MGSLVGVLPTHQRQNNVLGLPFSCQRRSLCLWKKVRIIIVCTTMRGCIKATNSRLYILYMIHIIQYNSRASWLQSAVIPRAGNPHVPAAVALIFSRELLHPHLQMRVREPQCVTRTRMSVRVRNCNQAITRSRGQLPGCTNPELTEGQEDSGSLLRCLV